MRGDTRTVAAVCEIIALGHRGFEPLRTYPLARGGLTLVRWCTGSTPGSQPDSRSSILLRRRLEVQSPTGKMHFDVDARIARGRAPACRAEGRGFESLYERSMGKLAPVGIAPVVQAGCRGFESLRLRWGDFGPPVHGDRGVVATRWNVTPQSMGSTPSDRPNALVAQWRAHRLPEPAVAGSSPAEGAQQWHIPL